MASASAARQVESLRRFNRFYTRRIGALEEGLLKTPFSLTQARVLFELGTREPVTAGEIAATLGLDLGYLSRILQGFETDRLVTRRRSTSDGRRIQVSLTAKGRRAFADLDARSRAEVSALLDAIPETDRARLFAALDDVRSALAEPDAGARPAPGTRDRVRLRTHRLGDVGWAIERHARLYADEFDWNEEFEALVATLFARFATTHDPERERFWVAELDGERVGCVFVVRNADDPEVAQLRCLLVDPKGRGLGIGRRLVEECLAFARAAGYRRMILWTNDVLAAARRIYEAAGFELVEEKPHHSFGRDLVGQVWSLELR